LTDLGTARALDALAFGNAVWNKVPNRTFEPLTALGANIRHLAFNAKSIADRRIPPLASLMGLVELKFPLKCFITEQLA
jgi:hypothetical protein